MNPELMAKLERQEQLQRQKAGNPIASDGVTVDSPPMAVFDSAQNLAAQEARRQAANDGVQVTRIPNEATNNIQRAPQQMIPTPEQTYTSTTPPVQASGKSIQERIAAAEAALGSGAPMGVGPGGHKQFLDEYGNETFYVKNISNGHVTVSDVENIVVKKNTVVDLLKMADIESIRKSRDLRNALQSINGAPWLQRLTPEEYLVECEKAYETKLAVEKIKSVNSVQNTDPNKIRPMVFAKLEKLNLSYKTDTVHLGMAPVEFVEWALTANLSYAELDYIIGSVTDLNIKKPLLQKKAALGSGM